MFIKPFRDFIQKRWDQEMRALSLQIRSIYHLMESECPEGWNSDHPFAQKHNLQGLRAEFDFLAFCQMKCPKQAAIKYGI